MSNKIKITEEQLKRIMVLNLNEQVEEEKTEEVEENANDSINDLGEEEVVELEINESIEKIKSEFKRFL